MTTTVMAAILGLCLVSIIRPGDGNNDFVRDPDAGKLTFNSGTHLDF